MTNTVNNVKNTVMNLFNKQTKKIPKKFVMDVGYNTYNCRTDGDILTCVLQNTEHVYNYKLSEDDFVIKFLMDDDWVITTIFDEDYDSESDNSSFDNCYINVAAFAKKHNISLETAHYLIQPWLFSMGHSWGIFMGKSVAHVDEEFLVFDEGRICREDEDYLEERDELSLNYSPIDGITYVIVPFKAPFVKPKTKRTGWVNVYKHAYSTDISTGSIHNTKEEAIEKAGKANHLINTIEVSWEE